MLILKKVLENFAKERKDSESMSGYITSWDEIVKSVQKYTGQYFNFNLIRIASHNTKIISGQKKLVLVNPEDLNFLTNKDVFLRLLFRSSDKLVEKKCFNENPYYVSIKGKSYDNLIQSLFSKKKRALPSEALIRLQDKLDNSSEREASPKISPVLRRSTRNITSLFSRNDYFKEKILSGTSEGLKVEIIEGKGRGVISRP